MTRPPFPVVAEAKQLRLFKTAPERPVLTAVAAKRPGLIRGVLYALADLSLPDKVANPSAPGLLGGFLMSLTEGKLLAPQMGKPVFVWDHEAAGAGISFAQNEFHLLTSTLEGPEIFAGVDGEWLTILPAFTVSYRTAAFAAALGEIRLVESKRFLTLENGEQVNLLDTHGQGEPVLFLEGEGDHTIVRQQTPWQPLNKTEEYRFDYRISQPLMDQCEEKAVSSITVLEQYTSFFMQRPRTLRANDAIWVPACAPVTWGWSMRVEPADGNWRISRRKLMLPTVGHEGWRMPEWRANTVMCTCSM